MSSTLSVKSAPKVAIVPAPAAFPAPVNLPLSLSNPPSPANPANERTNPVIALIFLVSSILFQFFFHSFDPFFDFVRHFSF